MRPLPLQLKHHCPKAPIILVGTKTDLRKEQADVVSQEEGQRLAKQIKALRYMECSALTKVGLKEVFDAAITSIVCNNVPKPASAGKKSCILI
jgi:GTPase SAR1 family protein